MSDLPTISALAPWFGSNRTLAENVGRALEGCVWVGVPFAGGMCELLHIKARTVLVGDLHAHVLNLAAVVADGQLNPQLRARLDGLPYHPEVLAAAQARCRAREAAAGEEWFGGSSEVGPPDLDWAADFFVCSWMARNGCAGTRGEFAAGLSVRWDAGGGDSATRFRNASDSLAAWQRMMRGCTFVRMSAHKFLAEAKDQHELGLYCDPPFPDAGDGYKYAFDETDQRQLAGRLVKFNRTAVVVRFYDHPLIRELYPESKWLWHSFVGRKQTNEAAGEEVLLTRNVKE